MKFHRLFALLLGVVTAAASMSAASLKSSLEPGKAALQSAGPLAFGPEGILFAGDPVSAKVFALDTGDAKPAPSGEPSMMGLQEKIAAHLGATPDQILVNDMAVNPVSHRIYLSVSRGRGPEATPVILRLTAAGKIEELKLESIRHASADIPNAPASDAKDGRGQSKRNESITDLAYVDGKVIVAGLSNEEFASTLRSIPFPFKDAAATSTNVEIFHGAHGRYETNAPVRTFTAYTIASKPHILAAYTCTPLVRIPLSDLKPGSKVMGTTIAELGNRNRPLDMIVYSKGGSDYILMNNSSRGVMKLPAAKLDSYQAITKPTDITGVPYETLAGLKGVEQLDRLDEGHALMLVRTEAGGLNLQRIALP